MNQAEKKYTLKRLEEIYTQKSGDLNRCMKEIKDNRPTNYYDSKPSLTDEERIALFLGGQVTLRPEVHEGNASGTDLNHLYDYSSYSEVYAARAVIFKQLETDCAKALKITLNTTKDMIMLGDSQQALDALKSLQILDISAMLQTALKKVDLPPDPLKDLIPEDSK